jgi:predicted metal-dependent peptidase
MAEGARTAGHLGTPAIRRMVEYAPSTGGLALWVRHVDLAADPGDAPIATDGLSILYGPSFADLPLPIQTGLVAHEVLHVALRHAQRYLDLRRVLGDVDLALYNVCADAIVNSALSHLGWLALPPGAVRLEQVLSSALDIHQPVEKSLLEWNVERLYRAIDDRRPPYGSGRRARSLQRGAGPGDRTVGPAVDSAAAQQAATDSRPTAAVDGPRSRCARGLGRPRDRDLRPGPDTSGPPETEAERTREWSERIVRAHAGDAEHSMLRNLTADLSSTRTPWEHMLAAHLARHLACRPTLSWSRPTRSYLANQGRIGSHRLPWEPGRSGIRPVPRLVVVVDVSGSVEDDLMRRFSREIETLVRRLETSLVLVIGDDRVRRVEAYGPGSPHLPAIEFEGGGGTDFTPLLEAAAAHRPDVIVALTDLQGPARFRPRVPVLWAVPEAHRDAAVPFGRKLVID